MADSKFDIHLLVNCRRVEKERKTFNTKFQWRKGHCLQEELNVLQRGDEIFCDNLGAYAERVSALTENLPSRSVSNFANPQGIVDSLVRQDFGAAITS
jgi:hypothetical protein